MKTLTVVPTVHTKENPNYTPEYLAELIIGHKPDVVFVELPANFEMSYFDSHPECMGQEMTAIRKAGTVNNFAILPVEIPYRNEIKKNLCIDCNDESLDYEILQEAGSSRRVRHINEQLERVIQKLESLTSDCTMPVYLSRQYRQYIRRQRRLNTLLAKYLIPSAKFRLQYSELFNFKIREQIIGMNCLNYMAEYDRGLLLLGAAHVDIVRNIKKLNTDKAIKIQWIECK